MRTQKVHPRKHRSSFVRSLSGRFPKSENVRNDIVCNPGAGDLKIREIAKKLSERFTKALLVEIVALSFALKCKFPDYIYLMRMKSRSNHCVSFGCLSE
jgi:hypothetical protein